MNVGKMRRQRAAVGASLLALIRRLHRPKYGCRACEGAVVQAPAPERLIKSGISGA